MIDINNDTLVIKQMIDSKLPIFIYGFGEVADFVKSKMNESGINVEGYFIDDIFFRNSDSNIIFPFSYLNDYQEKFNIVIGFIEGYKISSNEIRDRINNINLHEIFYLSEIYNMEELTLDFIYENKEAVESVLKEFVDEKSRKSFLAYKMAKTTKDYRYLKNIYCDEHYFPKDFISLDEDECFVDCGAYTGDTIKEFITLSNNRFRHIFAIEADSNNMSTLKHNYSDDRIKFCELAVFDKKTNLLFDSSDNMLSKISEDKGIVVKADKLDNIININVKCSFIKMDIEGAEIAALKGAKQIIKTHKPKLAISIYHKQNDLLEIYKFLKELVPEYQFYFRVHKPIAIDAVLYAVVKS